MTDISKNDRSLGDVLVVDDTPDNLMIVSGILRRAGFGVQEATCGSQALASAIASPPVLILLDVMMPDVDGYEVCRKLKARDDTRPIPIIFITAMNGPNDRVRGFEAGGVDYISKPILAAELLSRVKTHIELGKSLRILASENTLGKAREAADRLRQDEDIRARKALLGLMEDQKLSSVALQKSEARYRHMFANNPQPMCIYDEDTLRFLEVNEAAVQLYGYSREDFFAMTLKDIRPQEEVERFVALARGIARTGESFSSPGGWHHRKKNGDIIDVSIASHSVEFEGRAARCVMIEDITAQRKAEDGLRRQSDEWKRTFDSITDLVSVHDRNFKILRVNKAFAQMFGCSRESFEGQHCFGIVHKTCEPIGTCPLSEILLSRKATTKEMFEPTLNRFIEVTVSPVLDEQGEVMEIIHLVKDITERKNMELELSQARKLESVGQLAAGIAHEINTPTQFIGDNTRFLKDAFPTLIGLVTHLRESIFEGGQSGFSQEKLAALDAEMAAADLDYLVGEIPKAIGQTMDGIERVSSIVRAMKDFSHPDEGEKLSTDINRAMETTVTVARNEWKYVAVVEFDLDPNLPLVACYAGQINQVILNLLVNAAHAIAAKGTLDAEKGVIRVSTRRVDDSVEIRMSDTGTGIAEANRSRMFEQFFTTKEVGKGTGQGLAMCRQIVVNRHGGKISFETEDGKGTTFIVSLPVGGDR